MAVPLRQSLYVGWYIIKQKVLRNTRYPLVLMLEPLFRCNLACAGCGKIDYPDPILNRRLSTEDCLKAVDECGAPVVSIPGGEPLLHKEIGEIVDGIVARKKFVYLCTNALLLEKKLHLFKPSPFLTFSVHLDGMQEEHDSSVCQDGVFDRAVKAIRATRDAGFRVNVNCTLFDNAEPEKTAEFFDFVTDELDVEGITVSPGYAYERAPDQAALPDPQEDEGIVPRFVSPWQFQQLALQPVFDVPRLPGRQSGIPVHSLGQSHAQHLWLAAPVLSAWRGYADSFGELMEDTEWDKYGTGNYEKCADCMVHCGYEPTAVNETVAHPLQALKVWFRGVRTEGPMAPEISLEKQRPSDYVFDEIVQQFMTDTHAPAKADGSSSGTAKRSGEERVTERSDAA